MRLMKSPLLRNIAAVATGAAAGQAVAFAFAPLIARIYSPETFGIQGVFLSLVSILSPIIALRYPMAIVVARDEDEATSIARLSLIVAAALAGLLAVILAVSGGPLLRLLGAEGLGSLIWFLPPALFCVALQDVADFRATRAGRFRLVGIVTVTQAILTNLARVLGGLAAPVAGTLVAVTTIAPSVQAALLRIGNRRPPQGRPALSRADTSALIRRHRDFPLYRVPTDVLNSASQSVPVILLAALFTPAAAGLYVMTRSVLNLPSNIIGAAVGNVLYARFAEIFRDGQPLMPLLLRATLALLAVSPAIIGLAWFAPAVFAVVFGEEWREAGHYAQWMSLWLGVSIANVPAVRIAPIIEKQKLLLEANAIILLARACAMTGAYWLDQGPMSAVAVFSIVSLLANGGLILVLVLATRQADARNKTRPEEARQP